MLGMVLTELHEFVEAGMSYDVADAALARARLSGVWAATGLYDDEQVYAYVGALAAETGTHVSELLLAFGRHLLVRFAEMHPEFFEGQHGGLFDFIEGIESRIHSEVRRLWPGAVTPTFTVERDGNASISLTYESPRGLAHLARGLLEEAVEHYGEPVHLDIVECAPSGARAVFRITRDGA